MGRERFPRGFSGIAASAALILGAVFAPFPRALAQNSTNQSSSEPSAIEIIRRSVDRDWTDFESQKNYTYQQTVTSRRYNAQGEVTSFESKTNEVLILGGRPYHNQIAKDGKPLSERDARKERRKLDREAARRANESPSARAKWERERAEDRAYIREVPEAFTFRLLGQETVSGQNAWVIEAEPKPGYRPRSKDAKVFTKVRAKIWIEPVTYHWVRLDAEVLDTMSFGFGLLRIAPGGTLHFEQTHVNSEIWLPSKALIRADARLALVRKLRAQIDVDFSQYRKFQTDSRIVSTGEANE